MNALQAIGRRRFLELVGTGSAAAAASAVLPGLALAGSGQRTLTFRAETGLPQRPWPAYATAVVEGNVDLSGGTGLATIRMLAGQPGNAAGIGLPGTTQVVRITGASRSGSTVQLKGVVEDRSTLRRGQPAGVSMLIDLATRELRTSFLGSELRLPLREEPARR